MTYYPKLVEVSHELLRGVKLPLLQVEIGPTEQDKGVILFLAGKACKTYEAIVLLDERGFGQDAGVLTRSLLELAINVLWINEDLQSRAEMYRDYDAIVRLQADKTLARHPELLGTKGRPSAEYLDATRSVREAEAARAKRKHGFTKNRWSSKTIQQMAKEVDLDDHYEYAYRNLSNIEHSISSSSKAYVEKATGSYRLSVGPSEAHVLETLATAYDLMLRIFAVSDIHLGLGLANMLAAAEKKRALFLKE